jgi:hypothetical protein
MVNGYRLGRMLRVRIGIEVACEVKRLIVAEDASAVGYKTG